MMMRHDELKTPCFIIKDEILKNNLIDFQRVIKQTYPEGIVGYSFKTNSLPYILKLVRESGCYAEVVSDTEYCLAERMGFSLEKIIYNGPIKSRETFQKAYYGQSIINIDSSRELEWLSEMPRNQLERGIGLRVNFDLESQLPNQTATGADGGRFGFSLEKGNLHRAIEYCRGVRGIRISGLHMHVSSKTKSVEIFEKLAEAACNIIKSEKLNMEYLDIGGGFFGGADGGAAYKHYMSSIYRVLERHDISNIKLIVEPGAAVIATAVDYMTTVLENKDTSYGRYVITDGSRLHIDSFFRKSRHSYSIDADFGKKIKKQVICGYTCMENDRIIILKDEAELCAGNKIVYHTVGSYTMCLNPLFIEYLPYVYAEDKGNYKMVRDKWEIDEYLQKNYF